MSEASVPKDRASEKSESAISEKTEDKVGIESSDSGKDSPEAAVITSEDGAVGNGAPEFVTGIRLHVIFFALLLCMFLVALDMTIVATAIPKITEDFHSLEEVGWYGSAFFITLAVFQSSWGKGYKYFPLKYTFFTAVAIFEIGSLVCATARNSTILIVGRAIQGLGGAGITGGCYVIVAYLVEPSKVSGFSGWIGAVFSIASVAGPLLGGVFAEKLSWRWCFYVNLPVGGAGLLALVVFFKTPSHAKPAPATKKEKFLQMDVPGIALAMGSLTCLVLALEWGGVRMPWNEPRVVGTLVACVVLVILFMADQWKQKERASLVLRIISHRHMAGGGAFEFFLNSSNLLLIYNLPLYFQAAKGSSPVESGIQNLPLIMASSVFCLITGYVFSRTTFLQPFLLLGSSLITLGAGLLYSLDIDSPAKEYLSYQFLVGMGVGCSIQIPIFMAQGMVGTEDIACATGIMLFFQLVAGAIGVSAAQSIFTNRLLKVLGETLPELDTQRVIQTGVTQIRSSFSPEEAEGILKAYMAGFKASWALAIGLGGIAILSSFTVPFRKVRERKDTDEAQSDKVIESA